MLEKFHALIRTYVQKLEQYADRYWYPPFIGLLAALDNLVVFIPNDGILIASSMLVPKRWCILAFSVAVGSTVGAATLSLLVEYQGLPWILEFYPNINSTEMWQWSEKFFDQYGLLLVFAIGISPFLQQPIIILASLADTPLLALAGVIFISRFIKFLVMAYIGSYAPHLLNKMWGLKDELKEAGIDIKDDKA